MGSRAVCHLSFMLLSQSERNWFISTVLQVSIYMTMVPNEVPSRIPPSSPVALQVLMENERLIKISYLLF